MLGFIGFLYWIESEDVKVKCQIDLVGDQIRVMIVYGFKGLEVFIVILFEMIVRDIWINDIIFLVNDVLLWKMFSKEMLDCQQ